MTRLFRCVPNATLVGGAIVEQAMWWLRALHHSSLAAVDSSPRRARQRLVAAWGLVDRVEREGVAEGMR